MIYSQFVDWHSFAYSHLIYFFRALSISAWNCANGWAPPTSFPFTNDAGVPVTPTALPSAVISSTAFLYFPESKHELNLNWSNLTAPANFLRFASENAPWFSPC